MIGEDIKTVAVRKGSIETVLEIIRDIYKADICALFLIMEDMHEDEKLQIFEERLKFIKKAYDEKNEELPQPLKKYCEEYSGKIENLKKFLREIDILKFSLREAQNPDDPSVPDPDPKTLPGKLWKYDYSRRPHKWVIFKNYTEKGAEKSILFEGLTAYAVRVPRDIFISDSIEMKEYCCVTHLNARVPKPPITPECKMVAFFTLRDPQTKQVTGLLKIENYKEISTAKDWFNENSQQTEEARKYLPLLEKLIKKSKESYKEYSYEKLYGGMKLLELLKKVTTSGSLDQEIYDATHHLFCVLYRKEYVGHEDIMNRVTNYAEDISYKLKIFKEKGFFRKLLERRLEHEHLMLYKTEGYRDHFMHQFHVFVTGYIILHHIGLSKVRDLTNTSLSYSQPPQMLNEEDILRIWFLTSFMHDAAYIFEFRRFCEGMGNLFKDEWGCQFTFESSGPQFLYREKQFSQYLAKMIGFFRCEKPTNNQEILRYYVDSIINMNDHGVLSALWLLEKLAKKDVPPVRAIECYLSALSISFHNPNIFEHLSEDNQEGISFESFPIAFLLIFCDTLEIWGRTIETKENVYPELVDITLDDKELNCKLIYKTTYPDMVPTQEELSRNLIQSKDAHFRSSIYRFKIEFYKGEEWPKSIRFNTVPFKYDGK